ncbi:MAG: lipoprotein-releasing ABC transporter permease subunit [Reyranellaceae bacterium]
MPRLSQLSLEWLVAWRLLRARHREGFISVIAVISLVGIALGVGVLIVTLSVMSGFRSELYGRILGLNGHVVVNAAQGNLADFDAVVARIAAVPGVASAVPVVEGEVMATNRGNAQGALVRGLRLGDLEQRRNLVNGMVSGSLSRFEEGGLILGERLRRQLAAGGDDYITLLLPKGGGDRPVEPVTADFDLAGSFSIGMAEIDASYVFMSLEEAQRFFELEPGQVTAIDVLTGDPRQAPRIAAAIRQALGEGYKVSDWRQRNAAFVGALEVERAVMFFILTLIVLVAALNVVASFTMLVRSKARSIAILRTMGTERGGILRIFLMAGGFVGLAGTAIGAAVGLLLALNASSIRSVFRALQEAGIGGDTFGFFARLPAIVSAGEVMWVLAIAVVLSLAAAAYVAFRAAALEPAEVLRYE